MRKDAKLTWLNPKWKEFLVDFRNNSFGLNFIIFYNQEMEVVIKTSVTSLHTVRSSQYRVLKLFQPRFSCIVFLILKMAYPQMDDGVKNSQNFLLRWIKKTI